MGPGERRGYTSGSLTSLCKHILSIYCRDHGQPGLHAFSRPLRFLQDQLFLPLTRPQGRKCWDLIT